MSVLSDFFIASEAEASSYDPGEGWPESDRLQLKRITPLEAAGMLAVLRGDDDDVDLTEEFPFLTEDDEAWTMSVPADMVERLARLSPPEVPAVAAGCAEITVEELEWSAEDFEPVVAGLADLARRALASGKAMYLWNSL